MKTPPVQVGQIVQTTIDRLTLGGAGLSRVEGFVVFTPFTVPGDTVQIEIREVKKGFANAVLQLVIKPSALRVEAPCKFFGKCGGCDWQNISYENQLIIKQDLVKDVLKKFHLEPIELLNILKSPEPLHYRNRIQLHQHGKKLGFKEARSNSIVDIDDCLIAENELVEELKLLRENHSSKLARMDIRKTASGSVSVTNMNEAEAELGFSQVNTKQNERMIETLLSWAPDVDVDVFLDLYCGNGNLTFPMHKKLRPRTTIAVEMNKKAIEDGTRQAKPFKNIEFVLDSVDRYIFKFQKPKLQTCFVLLDPPRAGAGPNVMKKIATHEPQALIYVSCDPMTWARDIQSFLEVTAGKYRLEKVQPLDMFPQTYHIEIISLILPT